MAYLDPEFAQGFKDFLGNTSPPAPPAVGDIMTRTAMYEVMYERASHQFPVSEDLDFVDYNTTASDGHSILLRFYTKKGVALKNSPVVLYIYGGGLFAGTIKSNHFFTSIYATKSSIPMLAVEYRLAPKYKYPVPVEDCYAGLVWLKENAAKLGVDPSRIAVMGDSAGGLLAASVAVLARERNGPAIAKQILVQPMIDDRMLTDNSAIAPFLIWSNDDNTTAWEAYLGEKLKPGSADVPEIAAPARIKDAKGMPELYLDSATLDILKDGAAQYASKHLAANVPTEFHVHAGVPHGGYVMVPNAEVSKRAWADRVRAMQTIRSVSTQ